MSVPIVREVITALADKSLDTNIYVLLGIIAQVAATPRMRAQQVLSRISWGQSRAKRAQLVTSVMEVFQRHQPRVKLVTIVFRAQSQLVTVSLLARLERMARYPTQQMRHSACFVRLGSSALAGKVRRLAIVPVATSAKILQLGLVLRSH
jgi:hypothetical protein